MEKIELKDKNLLRYLEIKFLLSSGLKGKDYISLMKEYIILEPKYSNSLFELRIKNKNKKKNKKK